MASHDLSALRTAACVLTAMFILGIADNLIRLIAADIGLHQFHLLRSLLAGCGLLAFARWRGLPLRWQRGVPVVWRGVLVGLAMYLYFASLAFLPIGTVVAGLFTAPVFVVLISTLGFKHPLQRHHGFAVALGFAGMACITLPGGGETSAVLTLPVLAGFFYACANVIAREYCPDESTVVLSIAVFVALGALGAVTLAGIAVLSPAVPASAPAFVTLGWQPLTPRAAGLTAFHALCASLAITLLTFAYQRGLPARVAVLEYTLLVFASAFAWLFWREWPSTLAMTGMSLIAVSGWLISRQGRATPRD